MKTNFLKDFWISMITLLIMGGVYYSSPFQDWSKCRGLDKMLISDRPDLYEDLNCPKVIEEDLYNTKLGFSIPTGVSKEESVTKNTTKKSKEKSTSIFMMLFIVLVFVLAYALSAFIQALYLHCYLVAVLIAMSPFILLVLFALRKEIPLTLITFILSYSFIVSALYGMIFNPVVVIGSFLSFTAFIFLVSFTLLGEIIGKIIN